MDWIKSFNRVLDYIENNLEREIDYDELAKIANSSRFHFLRVFSILTGNTLGHYIMERRMSLATKEIKSGEKVIDTAYKYLYETPESFTKAFKRYHGVTPRQAKQTGIKLKASPPLNISISVKGGSPVDYKVEKKGEFSLVGATIRVNAKNGDHNKAIPQFWQDSFKNGVFDLINKGAKDLGTMGISYDYDGRGEEFSYMIGVEGEVLKDVKSTLIKVPKLTWAIFSGCGELPGSIQELLSRIYSEWFPATKYEQEDGPVLEVYDCHDKVNADFEVWIPIK